MRTALAVAPGVLLAGVAGGLAFPILPMVGARAGLALWFIGVILAANRFSRVFANPLVGALTDRLGGRRVLIVGLFIQAVVMSLYALGVRTHHPGVFFLLGRLVHGLGSSCVFVAGQALAIHAGGPGKAGGATGVVRASLSLGIPFGLVAGGLLSDAIGPFDAFLVALAAVGVAFVAAWLLVPDLRVEARRPARARDSLHALADRRLLAVGAINFAATFSASGVVLVTAVLLVDARRLSLFGLGAEGTAGALMGLMTLLAVVAMLVAGAWGDVRGRHAPVALGAIATLIPALMLVGLAQHTLTACLGFALLGVGLGAFQPALLALLAQFVPPERRGSGVGALQLCGDAGAAAGPIVGTALFGIGLLAPYLAAAALVACVVPVGRWLIDREREGGGDSGTSALDEGLVDEP